MQLRYPCDLDDQEYVTRKQWLSATLDGCPNHPRGGCRFYRLGYYSRSTRYGEARIVRYYCRDSHTTFSLLPDCFAARMPGTLAV